MTRVGQIFREKLVSDIKEGLDKKSTAFLLSYAQLSGAKSSEIRKKLSDAGADVYVSKNCLAMPFPLFSPLRYASNNSEK